MSGLDIGLNGTFWPRYVGDEAFERFEARWHGVYQK
jgi:hypothetical protein